MNTLMANPGIIRGCQQLTRFWYKRVLSFFTISGTSNRLVCLNNLFCGFASYSCALFGSFSAGSRSFPAVLSPSQTPGILEHLSSTPFLLRTHRRRPPPSSSTIALQLFPMNSPTWTTLLPRKSQYLHPPISLVHRSSCGRMYKPMKHLKRHVRSHTMERPPQCYRCKKKFSRQENFTQHFRILMRMDAGV
jgi:hypothetical protein